MPMNVRPVMKERYQNPSELARRIEEAEQAQRVLREAKELDQLRAGYSQSAQKFVNGELSKDELVALKVSQVSGGDNSALRTQDALAAHEMKMKKLEFLKKKGRYKWGGQTEEEFQAELAELTKVV